ncbi:uncharacterized protein E0L32_008082 [Thyridium curvatum]|uniref:Uncharacterized protein n=1 Tax=Thyridium curvatum TaxID=1093900 RepID=A0A507AKK9_9PEZI|nr:uncharacterized protein E0L32_008082 [Thyridium curvatum]TPX11045.1 hypothetical protein E0L32_008082 [Thyridium curvatum]
MSFDLEWDHQFCLACDKQTDGATYCSESCRLADYEKTSGSSSGASSPALSGPSYPWAASNSKFRLTPAYDFTNAQPYSAVSFRQSAAPSPRLRSSLSPSSSQSSLCSLKSSSSTATEASHLSAKAKKELRDYASSFEQARLQRRRSY